MFGLADAELETAIRETIAQYTARDRSEEALRLYESAFQLHEVSGARTHHAAFVAARETGADDETLEQIQSRAQQCADYDEVELDFERDKAVHLAEVKRNFVAAETAIQEVIRSRYNDEGQDVSQGLIDELAYAKIMVLSGNFRDAARYLRSLLDDPALSGQARLDADWWYYVVTLLRGENGTAQTLAGQSRKRGIDPKPKRRQAWRITLIPFVGPRAARAIIRRKLGL